MISNLERYKKDLASLINKGHDLHDALLFECFPDELEKAAKTKEDKSTVAAFKTLPKFDSAYQSWYSAAKVLIRQLLPDRLADFVRHYEKPKPRKDISFENYRIEDCLQGLKITRGWEKEKVVGRDAALPHLKQQMAILESVQDRFESSLFEIRQLVQADLFDSELEAAKELAKQKFLRAAGAVAGVVLERHLGQVCDNHSLKPAKKNPSIGDFNDVLKNGDIIDTPQWRFVQHLADIRNLCDHNKQIEPTAEQVNDLVSGVSKLTKTLF
jgi:hypothetical protein